MTALQAWAGCLAKTAKQVADTALVRKNKAGMGLLAASPEGRDRLRQMRASFQTCQAPLQNAGRELQGAVAAIDKALRKRSWGIRA